MKSRKMIILTVISGLILFILIAMKYTPQTDKAFSNENFYKSVKYTDIDPQAAFQDERAPNLNEDLSCNTTISKASNPSNAGSCLWIVDNQDFSTVDLNSLIVDGDSSTIKPYKDNEFIVSPTELVFSNANISKSSDGKIKISAYVGSEKKYLIVWNNVRTWWCHIGKDNVDQHTITIGCGGIYSKVTEGFIIGQAKADTTVTLYEVDDQGQTNPTPISSLFK